MIQVDTHVHSTFSKHPSEWFLQKIGARESYTPVETVYAMAKQRGMHFVTLTDHNTIEGALQLVEAHPEDCFISTEATAYFPEDQCKIHILCLGITPGQFSVIQQARQNIYELRAYLRKENITCSVAHATYNVNNRLTLDILEKLILLFNVFEGLNGARSQIYNRTWKRTLKSLTPSDITRLQKKHGIEPWGDTSWIKGFTGGSDDHAGLLIAKAYTMAEAQTPKEFLQRIRERDSECAGRHGNHKTLAFAIYKIAYHFSCQQAGSSANSFWNTLHEVMFSERKLKFRERLAFRKLKRKRESHQQIITRFFEDLVENRADTPHPDIMIDRVYDSLANLSDDFFTMISTSLEKDVTNGDPQRLIKNISAALPAAFLAAPFFSTMRHLHRDRDILRQLELNFGAKRCLKPRSILWFSDTVTDLNGVSISMQQLAECAHRTGRPMKLATSLPASESHKLPPNTINLPCVYTATPEFYSAFTLRVPSLLKSIDLIAAEDPDEIIISTPGPIGLLGLVAARLLGVKCTGIYHTDFTAQVEHFIGDEWVSSVVELYTRTFYKFLDEVRVPTQAYINMLAERGLDPAHMSIFRRGIESAFPVDEPEQRAALAARLNLPEGFTFFWAGRLGKEKNTDLLLDLYERICEERTDCNLLIAGEGPELENMRHRMKDHPHVVFAGRIDRSELSHFYRLADAFIFPSTTDTFGMVILEAQACGLPCLVTEQGGPQEIVLPGKTGYVLPISQPHVWIQQMTQLVDRHRADPDAYAAWRKDIEELFTSGYAWETVLDEMLNHSEVQPAPTPAVHIQHQEPLPVSA